MAECSRNTCGHRRPDLIVRWAKLGLRVDGAWFCSDVCVEADAARRLRQVRPRDILPRVPAPRLGAVLLRQGVVTMGQLGEALDAQRSTGLRLGAQLQTLGHASREAVLRALSAQNGIGYLATIDPGTVRPGPGGLSRDEVHALGLVPFSEAADQLRVACAAPVPHSAIAALEALTGLVVEPYLVADDDFVRLAAEYGSTSNCSRSTKTVLDISDGAHRIAAIAAKARAVTITEAHVDPFTWIRITANGRISTLLVPPNAHQLKENAPWLAATTQH